VCVGRREVRSARRWTPRCFGVVGDGWVGIAGSLRCPGEAPHAWRGNRSPPGELGGGTRSRSADLQGWHSRTLPRWTERRRRLKPTRGVKHDRDQSPPCPVPAPVRLFCPVQGFRVTAGTRKGQAAAGAPVEDVLRAWTSEDFQYIHLQWRDLTWRASALRSAHIFATTCAVGTGQTPEAALVDLAGALRRIVSSK